MHTSQIGVVVSPRTPTPSPHQIARPNRKSSGSELAAGQHRGHTLCQTIARTFRPEVVASHGSENFETTAHVASAALTSADALSVLTTSPLVLTGNVTLREILAHARLSKSTAYGYSIVPMYDGDGTLIAAKKRPPFPWLRLPAPIVKKGKKLWNASDVMAWFQRIQARASQASEESETDGQKHDQVTHGG